jgi:hypothetical protein
MAFKINGVTVLDDNREVTVDGITATANDRVFVGVTATNSPTSVLSPSIFQGSVSGYTSGGSPTSNVIDKFPFASDTNATDVGDLVQARGLWWSIIYNTWIYKWWLFSCFNCN